MNPKNARFFVLKSYSEDDVHRSIKYAIWCSTEHGNKRLDSAFRERDSRGPVFLFFSVNGSGHFCGMAEMMSCLDYSSSAGVWAQDKWKGKFQVRWIYVKDVPNSQLRHIRLENNENKPVTNSRDRKSHQKKGKWFLKFFTITSTQQAYSTTSFITRKGRKRMRSGSQLLRTRQMIEEEGKTEEIRTDVMVVVMIETIGEEMTDVTTEGIIETVIENMEEGAEAIITGEVENTTVTIVVRTVSAMGIATVIVTVLQEKQVEGGGEETERIGVDKVTEAVEEVVGVVEEEIKTSLDL